MSTGDRHASFGKSPVGGTRDKRPSCSHARQTAFCGYLSTGEAAIPATEATLTSKGCLGYNYILSAFRIAFISLISISLNDTSYGGDYVSLLGPQTLLSAAYM